MTDWRIPEGEPVCHEADSRIYTATYHLDNQTSIEVADDTGQLCLGVLLEINHGVPALHLNGKRAARTVLTGMCYSVGSATRQGSSSLTRFIGQSAMTSRT